MTHHLLQQLFGEDVAQRVGRVWGFDDATQELRNMWTRTPQPGLWFTAGAFSRARIYSRFIVLQIAAIEQGRLVRRGRGGRIQVLPRLPSPGGGG